MFNLFKIYDVGFSKVRVGPKKDGGYILLNEHSKNINNLLSFGVEDNIDFELDFSKKFKPSFTKLYDHTVKKLPKKNKFIFKKIGLGVKNSKNFKTLENISKNFDDNNILKMDIEYDEWSIFERVDMNTLRKFKQIVVEFHLFFLEERDVDSRNKLTPYFKEFSKNNYNKINKFLLCRYENVIKKLITKYQLICLPEDKLDQRFLRDELSHKLILHPSFQQQTSQTFYPILLKQRHSFCQYNMGYGLDIIRIL